MAIVLYRPGLSGCSDGNCLMKESRGMHTNGGCHCRKELMRSKEGREACRTIDFLRRQIKDDAMRSE